MDSEIRELLLGVQRGTVSVDQALLHLKQKPFEDLGYAKVDLHRKLRQGAGEVIYGAGKTAGNGAAEHACNALHAFKVALGGNGEARFNDVDAELLERQCDLKLLPC